MKNNIQTIKMIHDKIELAVKNICSMYEWFETPNIEFIDEPTKKVAYFTPLRKEVTFNLQWMNVNHDKLGDIVIHELTHAFLRQYSIFRGLPPFKSHGIEFRRFMSAFGGVDCRAAIPLNRPELVKEKKAARAKTTYKYTCGCKIFNITANRHTRILKGKVYKCVNCKNTIKPV